ncbi:PX domain-containing protein, partial [Rhodotorula toruloides]
MGEFIDYSKRIKSARSTPQHSPPLEDRDEVGANSSARSARSDDTDKQHLKPPRRPSRKKSRSSSRYRTAEEDGDDEVNGRSGEVEDPGEKHFLVRTFLSCHSLTAAGLTRVAEIQAASPLDGRNAAQIVDYRRNGGRPKSSTFTEDFEAPPSPSAIPVKQVDDQDDADADADEEDDHRPPPRTSTRRRSSVSAAKPPISPTLSKPKAPPISSQPSGPRKLVRRKSKSTRELEVEMAALSVGVGAAAHSQPRDHVSPTSSKSGDGYISPPPQYQERSVSRTHSRNRSRTSAASPPPPQARSSPPTRAYSQSSSRPYNNDVPSPDNDDDFLSLTPQDRHYLSRILVNLQMQKEFSALSQVGTLTRYGNPFLSVATGPNSKPRRTEEAKGGLFGLLGGGGDKRDPGFDGYRWDEDDVEDSPICQYLYWRFLYNMPGLRNAKLEYWQENIQPFFDSFAERDLSSTVERGEVTKRRMLSLGFVRVLGTYYSTCYRPLGPSAPARPTISMMRKIDLLVPGSMDSMWGIVFPDRRVGYNAWVAVVQEKEERGGGMAFRIVSRVVVAPGQPLYHALQSWSAIQSFASSLASLDSQNRLDLPLLPRASSPSPPSRQAIQRYLRLLVITLSAPPPSLEGSPALTSAREKLESFLLGSAGNQKISNRDLAEWVRRGEEEEDEDDKKHVKWVEMGRKVKKLRTTWANYRKALIEGDEIDKSMAQVRRVAQTSSLPAEYRDAEEWATIWVAGMLHYIFAGSVNGSEILNILKSFHSLIPYGPIKLGLSLVNPTLAIRAIVQLLLGQPAGQLSLFQRIWQIVCNAANRHQRKLIEKFRKQLGHDSICDALHAHVQEGYVQRQKTKKEALDCDEDIVLTILRERGSQRDYELVEGWHEDFVDSGGDPTHSSGAKSFADLKELLAAYYRYRDREQVLAIALEANTPRLLHASIATFYQTIHDVANASKLSERVGDIQYFLDDMIKCCETGKTTRADFINLARRHHEKVYYFVRELATNNEHLLDPLLDWSRSGLTFIHTGIPPSRSSAHCSPSKRASVDLDSLLPSNPKKREKIVREVRSQVKWTRYKKAQNDMQLRIDLLQADAGERKQSWEWKLDRVALWQEFLAQLPEEEVAREPAG